MGSKTGVPVRLDGEDGNAFAILGKVRRAMREAGVDRGVIADYAKEAMAGDYDDLLQVTMEYVEVEWYD